MHPQHERQVFRTLSYFDSMNLAPQVRCPTLVAVGLVAKCCPPSSIFGTINHLQCTKEFRVYRYHEHVDVLRHFRHKLAWAQRYLLSDRDKPETGPTRR
jgi:cephalosporin-C deacetylase